MDHRVPHLKSVASLRVLAPILGIFGGLGLGALRAWLSGAADIAAITLVVSGGVIGSALGMTALLWFAYPIGPARPRSPRSLTIWVLVAALVLWFALALLTPVFH